LFGSLEGKKKFERKLEVLIGNLEEVRKFGWTFGSMDPKPKIIIKNCTI